MERERGGRGGERKGQEWIERGERGAGERWRERNGARVERERGQEE